MQSHCDQIAISWHEARNRSTCRLWHSFFTGVRRVSSKRAVNNKTNERRSVHRGPGMLVSNRLHVREKSSETDHTCPGQLLILLVHHAHGFELVGSCWTFVRNEVSKFTRRRSFFLWTLRSARRVFLAKHGERCRIWEAERCTASERFALGVGRTRVRDEAEPLHDEALSSGEAIFFVVPHVR